nr:dihydrofolate reductase family protein [Marinitoga sp. 38H-ov]
MKDKKIFVLTSRELKKRSNVEFINSIDIVSNNLGKNIWVYGGRKLVSLFLKENIIDEFIIGIIPIILGKGIPLFIDNRPIIDLKLINYYVENDIVILRYKKI